VDLRYVSAVFGLVQNKVLQGCKGWGVVFCTNAKNGDCCLDEGVARASQKKRTYNQKEGWPLNYKRHQEIPDSTGVSSGKKLPFASRWLRDQGWWPL